MDEREQVCTRKRAYSTEWRALKALLYREETAGVRGLHVYACPYCHQYHLGHPSKGGTHGRE